MECLLKINSKIKLFPSHSQEIVTNCKQPKNFTNQLQD